jgi:tetratricopeptide (TPR) repeat protein
LLSDLGQSEQAETAFRRALDIRAKLAANDPTAPGYRDDLAQSQVNLGVLLHDLRQHEKSEAHIRDAIAIREELAAEFPTVPDYRADWARALNGLGNVLKAQWKYEAAEAAMRQAVAIQEKLAAEFRKVPAYRRDLFAVQSTLGNVLSSLGKRPEAEAAYRQAIVVAEGLAAEFADVPQHAMDLGAAYCNLGSVVRNGGQPEPALDWYRKAIATLEPVVKKESSLVVARQHLCMSHQGRATTLEALGRHDEATRDWDRALELDDGSNKLSYRLRISRNKKDAAGCLAAAAEYEAMKGTDAGALYDAACNRGVCAAVIPRDPKTPAADAARLAKEQADLAMAWLRKAVAAGYRGAEHMKQDKDLDAVRERGDFKKLLAELRAKQK